jgi:hypothetical protein
MYQTEAYWYLYDQVSYAPKNIKTITVIHGYKHGDKLLRMVREEFWNDKVIRKLTDRNPGVTKIYLM